MKCFSMGGLTERGGFLWWKYHGANARDFRRGRLPTGQDLLMDWE